MQRNDAAHAILYIASIAACAATAAAQTAPDRTVLPIDHRTVERVNAAPGDRTSLLRAEGMIGMGVPRAAAR